MKITYAKGIYTLTDDVKTYTFNINNGQLINTKTSRTVSKPTFRKQEMLMALYQHPQYQGYKDMIDVLWHYLTVYPTEEFFGGNVDCLPLLSILDKLLNVMPKGYSLVLAYQKDLSKLSTKQLEKVIKYVREYNDPTDHTISIRCAIQRIELEEFAASYGNLPIDFVEEHKPSLDKLYNLGEEYRDIALYYYYTQKLYRLRNDINERYAAHTGTTYIITYIKCCKAMNKTPIKTNNFMREYLETLNAYDLWEMTSQQNAFSSVYNRYKDNLLFEYGDYQVVLPRLTQDLITEGNKMHHCVGDYISEVAKGNTLIVFVRHKSSPTECYITAQVNPRNGSLGQYYLAYDRSITKVEDIEFKAQYQKWLKSKQWWR